MSCEFVLELCISWIAYVAVILLTITPSRFIQVGKVIVIDWLRVLYPLPSHQSGIRAWLIGCLLV